MSPQGAKTIFVVDDEEMIVELVSTVLLKEGYSVETATDSRKALEKISAKPADYGILICDQKMPHLSGSDLIGKLRTEGFKGKVVIHSGNVAAGSEAIRHGLEVDAVLTKPVRIAALADTIRLLAL